MNHIDMYETYSNDQTISYEIRNILRNLYTMKMNDMLQARELINQLVDKKHNDYMVIFINEKNKEQI